MKKNRRHSINYIVLALCFCFFLFSFCTKKKINSVEVTYEVTIPQDNKVVINYQSDYADATGNRKDIVYNTDSTNIFQGSLWSAKRIIKDNQKYYIKVTYTKLKPKADSSYSVVVYKGDNIVAQTKGSSVIELTGGLNQ